MTIWTWLVLSWHKRDAASSRIIWLYLLWAQIQMFLRAICWLPEMLTGAYVMAHGPDAVPFLWNQPRHMESWRPQKPTPTFGWGPCTASWAGEAPHFRFLEQSLKCSRAGWKVSVGVPRCCLYQGVGILSFTPSVSAHWDSLGIVNFRNATKILTKWENLSEEKK